MNVRTMIALGIASVLIGILISYLYWGQRSGQLASELAEVKARLATQTEQAAASKDRVADQRRPQIIRTGDGVRSRN